jgi:hypothetical protein
MTLRIIFLTALLFVSPAHAQESKLQSVICCTRSGCGKLSVHPYRLTPTATPRAPVGEWALVQGTHLARRNDTSIRSQSRTTNVSGCTAKDPRLQPSSEGFFILREGSTRRIYARIAVR